LIPRTFFERREIHHLISLFYILPSTHLVPLNDESECGSESPSDGLALCPQWLSIAHPTTIVCTEIALDSGGETKICAGNECRRAMDWKEMAIGGCGCSVGIGLVWS